MPANSDTVGSIFMEKPDFENIRRTRPRIPFDGTICALLSAVSQVLLKDLSAKDYPDVATFAFWCRKANLERMKKAYSTEVRIGRGAIFHITPSNVPVNFAYSLAAGLLSGNTNIVRVPTKEFPQVDMISNAFKKMGESAKFRELSPFITLLRYERNDEINKYLSSICDVRIIWGGDNAISDIRRASLNPRSFDITFADRYSICLINADEYLKDNYPDKIAQDFYNDTYLFDQNACTAPHLVVWIGADNDVEAAKRIFWEELHKIVFQKYTIQPVQAVDKLTMFYRTAVEMDAKRVPMSDNLIVRVRMESLQKGIENYRCQGGYFVEYTTNDPEDIVPIINRKYQTLSYYGFKGQTLREFIINNRLCGIDRIVKIGHTMDFSLYWDGYDLVRILTRQIDI